MGLDWKGREAVTKLSAGFCNAVYHLELDVPAYIIPKVDNASTSSGWLRFVNLNDQNGSSSECATNSIVKRHFVVKIFSQVTLFKMLYYAVTLVLTYDMPLYINTVS